MGKIVLELIQKKVLTFDIYSGSIHFVADDTSRE